MFIILKKSAPRPMHNEYIFLRKSGFACFSSRAGHKAGKETGKTEAANKEAGCFLQQPQLSH